MLRNPCVLGGLINGGHMVSNIFSIIRHERPYCFCDRQTGTLCTRGEGGDGLWWYGGPNIWPDPSSWYCLQLCKWDHQLGRPPNQSLVSGPHDTHQ